MTALALGSGAPKHVYASTNNEFPTSTPRGLTLGVAYVENNCERLKGNWLDIDGLVRSMKLPSYPHLAGFLDDTDQTHHPGASVALDGGETGTDFGAFNGRRETVFGQVTYDPGASEGFQCVIEHAQIVLKVNNPATASTELTIAALPRRQR